VLFTEEKKEDELIDFSAPQIVLIQKQNSALIANLTDQLSLAEDKICSLSS